MILGVLGQIGSGKNSVAEYLSVHHGFHQMSFAESLKIAVAAIFGWEIELLNGYTKESRVWREQIDMWWANRLGIPHLTPRWVLQYWGTEIGRNCFHQEIWLASLERKLLNITSNVVVSDCRFPNEIETLRHNNGRIAKVQRGPLPVYFDVARHDAIELKKNNFEDNYVSVMSQKYPEIHVSEWVWFDENPDVDFDNNQDLDHLYRQVDRYIREWH
jgi:hypothetical protein